MNLKKCLLASDVDGTLMEQGYISPRNFEKINEFFHYFTKLYTCIITTKIHSVHRVKYENIKKWPGALVSRLHEICIINF